ncbi:hypothetical protein ALC53_05065 [Atta colombica]|uniref:Uncharacterized protein n=1 Tax=Atta colombica TaxID=520822 RepID=A0A151I4C7_9HYME|nr:hypothetical protein ALC53_05065 [Atta colombica]
MAIVKVPSGIGSVNCLTSDPNKSRSCLKGGNRILVVEEEFLLGTSVHASVGFVGERVSLGENRIETTDESGVSGGVSGKIRKIKMSDSMRETDSGMRESTRKDGEGEREAAIIGNGRIGGYGEPAGAGGAGSGS